MENSSLYLLIALAFVIYISFALGMQYLSKIIQRTKRIKAIIFVPIIFSFIFGFSIMLAALSEL